MDLWDSFRRRKADMLGSQPLLLNTGERWNSSFNAVKDTSFELPINKAVSLKYEEERRYLVARDINYDMLLTVYDINTRYLFAARITLIPGNASWKSIFSKLKNIRTPNFEFRAIGLQDNYTGPIDALEVLHRKVNGKFMEFDLFGKNTRHIVIDTKTGMPYDLLLLNKIYRAGELACQTKKEDFKDLQEVTFING